MGLYAYIKEEDRITKRVVSDPEMNELFQDALRCDKSLMIEECEISSRSIFGRIKSETKYNIYHESPAYDGSAYQMRLQASASGDRSKVVAYLHGIINGVHHFKKSI